MTWLLLGLATIAACEILLRVDLLERLRTVSQFAGRAARTVSNPVVSDHWKERVLPRYALRIATGALATFGCLLVALSPFLIAVLVGLPFDLGFERFVLAWQSMLACCAFAVIYLAIRDRFSGDRAAGDYSILDRVLHRLALGSNARAELLFDIEKSLAPTPSPGVEEAKHVFVTGLARAGTTVLMRAIYDSGQFASLTYKDMPFVLALNLWARFRRGGKADPEISERAHGDGILVSIESPEALEEPFWKCFSGTDYILPDALVPHRPETETLASYRLFVSHVLARYDASRYLAKNNNSILRLSGLLAAFPNAIILVPFRRPLHHAVSLHRQHARFSNEKDAFTHEYMGFLAHHEFGADHRPFVFDGSRPTSHPDDIDYWLETWVHVYQFLLQQTELDAGRIFPVAYEDLCGRNDIWNALSSEIGIASDRPAFEMRVSQDPPKAKSDLVSTADEIYASLLKVSRRRLLGETGNEALRSNSG
ncbi:MAG: sulfotransferase [Pseudomonadota bacterium]